jgi:hypothetical protein
MCTVCDHGARFDLGQQIIAASVLIEAQGLENRPSRSSFAG